VYKKVISSELAVKIKSYEALEKMLEVEKSEIRRSEIEKVLEKYRIVIKELEAKENRR